MRLGLASLLVALSSLLAPPPHSFTLAVTPPDDFTESPEEVVDIPSPNRYHVDQLPKCTRCSREGTFDQNKIDGAVSSNYGIAGIRPILPTRDLKTEDLNYTKLVVGYLTAVRGDLNGRQGIQISGAIKMALDEVSSLLDLDEKNKCSLYSIFYVYDFQKMFNLFYVETKNFISNILHIEIAFQMQRFKCFSILIDLRS